MREDTARSLQQYNVVMFGNKKNLEAAEAQIPPDESIIYIAPSNMTITPRNTTKGQLNVGVIVITNKNIYVFHNTMFEKGKNIFPISTLEFVSYKATGITGATFELSLSNATISFLVGYDKSLASQLHSTLNNLCVGNNQSDNLQQNSSISPADEILKYKNLLDIGAITQEEFDTKKKQLLEIN